MENPNPNPNACGVMEGSLPGKCAGMAFPYIPMQENSAQRYDQTQALAAGTLFPGLNLPFFRAVKSKMNCPNNALCPSCKIGTRRVRTPSYAEPEKMCGILSPVQA